MPTHAKTDAMEAAENDPASYLTDFATLAPDTHLFRVENGKLRYVHTLTHLLQANFRGGGAGRGGAGGRGAAGGGQGDGAPPTTPR